jgi:hypothetical protein
MCIVVADIVPDATADYSLGWLFLAAGFVIGVALMAGAGERRTKIGSAAAIAGMGLHNICEGIVMAAAGPAASLLVLAGAVAHKLPEGMVVFSRADRLSIGRRWAVAVLLSLLIPIGTIVALPESIQQPGMGFAAGVLVVILAKSLMLFSPIGRPETALLNRRPLPCSARYNFTCRLLSAGERSGFVGQEHCSPAGRHSLSARAFQPRPPTRLKLPLFPRLSLRRRHWTRLVPASPQVSAQPRIRSTATR